MCAGCVIVWLALFISLCLQPASNVYVIPSCAGLCYAACQPNALCMVAKLNLLCCCAHCDRLPVCNIADTLGRLLLLVDCMCMCVCDIARDKFVPWEYKGRRPSVSAVPHFSLAITSHCNATCSVFCCLLTQHNRIWLLYVACCMLVSATAQQETTRCIF